MRLEHILNTVNNLFITRGINQKFTTKRIPDTIDICYSIMDINDELVATNLDVANCCNYLKGIQFMLDHHISKPIFMGATASNVDDDSTWTRENK